MSTSFARAAPGINLFGFLEAESGLGEIARRMARGLECAAIPFAAIPYRKTPSRLAHPHLVATSRAATYDTNLICINANELPVFADDVGVDVIADRYSIGFWFWETNVFQCSDRAGFVYVDEIWTPSEYVRQAVARTTYLPVLRAPIPVEAPTVVADSRERLSLPSGFLFLFLFDFVSIERKNPYAAIDAFRRAFAPGEGPTLVLKSINGRERKPAQLRALQDAVADRADILVLDGYVSPRERDAYIAACDCYVSLHRSEGFGLTMTEAMACAKPVIATGYSGNLEFMDESTAYLVPCKLVPIPSDWWAFAPGAVWADPDVEAASSAMRRVYEAPAEARALGERARATILAQHSPERTARFIRERFQRAQELSPGSRRGRRQILRVAQEARRASNDSARSARDRGPAGFIRRSLLRALWPFLEERHWYRAAVVEALTHIERASRYAARRDGR